MAYIGQQPFSGSFSKLDDISSGFNGVTTTFNLTVGGNSRVAGSPQNLLISLDGVLQDPGSYTVNIDTIIFSEAPVTGTTFFGTQLGSVFNLGVPSDNSVTASKIDGTDALNFRQTFGIQTGGLFGQWKFPVGTTAQRPAGEIGGVRFNSTNDQAEVFTNNSGWSALGGAQAGGVLYETKSQITANYTLSTGTNAVTVGQFTVADGMTLTVPDGQSVLTLSTDVQVGADNVTPLTNGTQTLYGVKTFANMPVMPVQSMVRVNNANGYGSTNTCIRRFSNVIVNQGTDITYADSATLGSSFTINTSGVYAISFSDNFSVSGWTGITLNSTAPGANIANAAVPTEILAMMYTDGTVGAGGNTSATVYLPAGSVIRPHNSGNASSTSAYVVFSITRVA